MENQKENAKQHYDASSVQISYESLGPTLYDGTSGIAYFLSQLHDCSPKEKYRNTAVGAIKHAIHKIESEKAFDFGFYTGSIGVIFIAIMLGKKIDSKELISSGLGILEEILKIEQNPSGMDIISGNAGAIPPLLSLYRLFDDHRILNLANRLGKDILSKGIKERSGLSWGSECNFAYNATHNLTGFAHGTAGMGFSLIELFKETNDEKFFIGGRKAFIYENSWFSKEMKNWPDFRSDLDSQGNDDDNYSMGWCHGSPGICFSRLRSYDLFKMKTDRQDAKTALSGIRKQILKNIKDQWDYSLCHGLGGIADLFLYASKVLNDEKYRSFADFIGEAGLLTYSKYGSLWPCGMTGGEMSGLMTGIAGVGQSYLRLCDDNKIPSILLPSIECPISA